MIYICYLCPLFHLCMGSRYCMAITESFQWRSLRPTLPRSASSGCLDIPPQWCFNGQSGMWSNFYCILYFHLHLYIAFVSLLGFLPSRILPYLPSFVCSLQAWHPTSSPLYLMSWHWTMSWWWTLSIISASLTHRVIMHHFTFILFLHWNIDKSMKHTHFTMKIFHKSPKIQNSGKVNAESA